MILRKRKPLTATRKQKKQHKLVILKIRRPNRQMLRVKLKIKKKIMLIRKNKKIRKKKNQKWSKTRPALIKPLKIKTALKT